MDDIILKAIAKDVDARYQSATAMLADLRRMEAALEGSVLNTRPLTPMPRSSQPRTTRGLSSRIRTAPTMLKVGLILLLVILGTGLALWMARPSMHQPSPEAKRWYENGTRAMRAGAFYEASKQLELSISNDDSFPLAHARLAQAYYELDNTDKAREELLRALSLRDQAGISSQDSVYVDAVAATVSQQYKKAIEHYHKLADQAADTDKASAYLDLGRAYQRTENIDKAQEYYQKAIEKGSSIRSSLPPARYALRKPASGSEKCRGRTQQSRVLL